MSEIRINSQVQALLVDSFNRIRKQVVDLTTGLTLDVAEYRPDADANSIAWLLWHLSRIQDDHLAGAAGIRQVWSEEGWHRRFGLPFDVFATGYGQSSHEVGLVRVSGEQLDGYHADVHDATMRYLARVDDEELARVVDDSWDPPVTAAVRLVSVIGDCNQHLGQAAYIRGLVQRRG
ncbi:mycothiol transferase [Tomitella biformata]|uniref:mycothiol transferase n=1 Tax=Tomitella biformata TaxID=630403 RepID=UPI0004AF9432|nr:DinB family protein [Tomitella biformata]